MKRYLSVVLMISLLPAVTSVGATSIPENLWPNPGFEEGENLDSPEGTPLGWFRGGSDPAICQVLIAGAADPSHAVAVNDLSSGYGEWYANLDLAGRVSGGDLLNLQWREMFSIRVGNEMRVTVLLFDANDRLLQEQHFVVRGRSQGWRSAVNDSVFSQRDEQMLVSAETTRLQVSLVSGGPESGTGIMAIDDFSVVRIPRVVEENPLLDPPEVLAGNFWPNPGFEEGVRLENPTAGAPVGWQRGGNNPSGDVVYSENWKSPTHALAVIDDREDAYSEWYISVPLDGRAQPGDELEAQWFEVYDIAEFHEMRLTFLFFDGDGQIVGESSSYARGQSEGWTGEAATSPLAKQNRRFWVPEGAVRLQAGLASGGSEGATGLLIIDDLSVRKSRWKIESLEITSDGVRITWLSSADLYYTVEASDTLSPPDFAPLEFEAEFIQGESGTTSYWDTQPMRGTRYYRVILEL